jgi:hypothetical protein
MGTTRPIDPDLRPAERPLTQPTALTPLRRGLVSCLSPNFNGHGKKENERSEAGSRALPRLNGTRAVIRREILIGIAMRAIGTQTSM